MYEPSFRVRRSISLLVTAIAMMVVGSIAWFQSGSFLGAPRLTGCTLLSSVGLLMLIGARRRLPVLPLGSMSFWSHCHLYLGIFSLGVYALHVPFLIGSGFLERGISLLFLLVSMSGLYGIYVSRAIPKRLTAVEVEPRFDRVRSHRHQIAEAARELLGELNEPSLAVLGNYYNTNLNAFFNSNPSLASIVIRRGDRRRRLLDGLGDLDRCLGNEGRRLANRFAELIRHRDDLDCQYALQLRLRLWLVIHGTLSIVLVVGSVAHAMLAWKVGG